LIAAATPYGFGTYRVLSGVALAALPPTGANSVDECIEVNWCTSTVPTDIEWHHHWRDGETVVLSLAKYGRDYWLRVPDIADFLVQISPSCRIALSSGSPATDAATLEHLLVDQLLPRLLSHRGECMVHASALAIEDRHALFLGPSGWGKSTLAGLLHRRGHRVLSDDCVQLGYFNDQLAAIPTYPSLRLNPDSLDALFPECPDTSAVADYSIKRRVDLVSTREAGTSVPVAALYLLGHPADASDAVVITPLRPAETCMALIKHSFRFDLADREATAAQLERCSHIARDVPAFRLDYPRDFTRHDELTTAVCKHLGAL